MSGRTKSARLLGAAEAFIPALDCTFEHPGQARYGRAIAEARNIFAKLGVNTRNAAARVAAAAGVLGDGAREWGRE
ncbi:MAG: hypothetical protein ACRDJH_16915 [Thermomicrobiales bacterium]